jgi:Helix-turn-helix domain
MAKGNFDNFAPVNEVAGHDLVTADEAARILGNLAPNTLAVWRTTKRYALPYLKVGRLVRYRRSDLEKFLASRSQ